MTTRDIQVFHSFGNYLPRFCPKPRTFTIHDFRLLDNPAKPGGGSRLLLNIKRSDGVICLTEHGKERLLFHAPDYDPQRIAIIPHGVDRSRFYPYDPSTVQQATAQYDITFPYVVQLGSWFPHKNLELSIRAFARSQAFKNGIKLVFVGGGAPPDYRSNLNDLAISENVQDGLKWIEHVSGEHLPLLLSGAQCLLQPSRYEGFALPILEAMAVGLPGVVSDSSCLPEVSGGLWPIAGQDDAASFAEGIDAMVLDEGKRNKAIQAGLERAAQFTWENAAAKTADFLRKMHRLGKRTETVE
jgi:alpha-1,3-rhamnosyl/mannosyltransferase